LEKADKMRFDINYLNEILCGEVVEIASAKIEDANCENAFAFEGKKAESKETAFRAELRIYS